MRKTKLLALLVCGALFCGCDAEAMTRTSLEVNGDYFNSTAKNGKNIVKEYNTDDFCRQFEADENFSSNQSGVVFTLTGTVETENDIFSAGIFLHSSFESEKWQTIYSVTCQFAGKSVLENVRAGDVVTVRGELYPLATNSIILQDCSLVSVIHSDSIAPSQSSGKENEENSIMPGKIEDDNSTSAPNSTSSSRGSDNQSTKPTQSSETSQSSSKSQSTQSTVQPQSSASDQMTAKPVAASYVLNTSTKKFHLPTCSSVKTIKDANYATSDSRESVIAQGYSPCKKCNP